MQLDDRVQQHLRPGRAARQVDIDRDDVIDALDDGVVVEHAAAGGAHPHRDDPLGVGHLVIDLPQHRRHLLGHPARHDHQVRLARRGRGPLHAEPGQVMPRPAGLEQFDRAAGQAEGGRPDRALARVAGDLLDRGQQNPARQLLFQTHLSRPGSTASTSRPPASASTARSCPGRSRSKPRRSRARSSITAPPGGR